MIDALVSTEWLAAHLGEPDLRVVDGSWHMPQAKRDPAREFADAHLPGAVFFDIDGIADTSSGLPHMLPSPDVFAKAVGTLGIGDGDRVVVYDSRGVVSAARVWWTFRVFGHDAIAVLDGGLPKWRAEGRALASGPATPAPRRFTSKLRPALVRDLAQVHANLATQREQVLDARSRGRFMGTEPEPRAGLRGGHIPGSLNLPYDELHAADGTLRPPPALREAFTAARVDLTRPVVTTCGSGITASVLALALHRVGRPDVAVYDGSWTEWAGREEAPVDKGDGALGGLP
jgi:thiosulfate/3-mercaptopyruvate sulfurtransferase